MIYLRDITEGANSCSAGSEFGPADSDAGYDSDAADFCSISSSELQEEDIDELPEHRPDDELAADAPSATAAFGLPAEEEGAILPSPPASLPTDEINTLPIPRGKSIAHHDFANEKIVLRLSR